MDKLDALIIAVAVYVAVASLVRLMAARRDAVIRHVQAEIDKQRAAAAQQDDRDAA